MSQAIKRAAVVHAEDRGDAITRCLSLLGDDLDAIKKSKHILIKPNLVALKPAFANTHVEAIEAVIRFIRSFAGDIKITVGESSATAFYNKLSTDRVFEDFKYTSLPSKFTNVHLTHFDDDAEYIDSPILSTVGDTKLRITKRVKEFDYKISLSIPKTHNFAVATFGIKNMAGLVKRQDMAMIHGMKGGVEVDAPKTLLDKLPPGTVSRARRTLPGWLINFLFSQYPSYRRSVKMIHHNIVEIAKRTWPDLVILDGHECMEGNGPVDGTSVLMNIAIASTDPVKADGLGARLIGFAPEEIGYLYYLQNEEHLGEYSLNNTAGDDIARFSRKFKRHGTYDIQSQWR